MMARPHRFAFTLFGVILALWLGMMVALMRASALGPEANGTMLVVFDPGITHDEAFAVITRAGARPIRQTSFGFIWVVEGSAGALTKQGALGTYRDLPISPVVAGCIAVVDAKAAAAFPI